MTENSHPLELIISPAVSEPGLQLVASVHNPTKKRVFLQVKTPEVYVISATLTDAAGESVQGMHTWANKGAAMEGHRFHEIPAGEAVHIDNFALDDLESSAL